MQYQCKYCKDQQDMNQKASEVKEKETSGPKQDQYQCQEKKHCNPAFH
jgi:hypothetical protein